MGFVFSGEVIFSFLSFDLVCQTFVLNRNPFCKAIYWAILNNDFNLNSNFNKIYLKTEFWDISWPVLSFLGVKIL